MHLKHYNLCFAGYLETYVNFAELGNVCIQVRCNNLLQFLLVVILQLILITLY